MSIEIKSIEVDIDGVSLKLTPEQASKLQSELTELLSSPTYTPYTPWPSYPYWYSPSAFCTGNTVTTTDLDALGITVT